MIAWPSLRYCDDGGDMQLKGSGFAKKRKPRKARENYLLFRLLGTVKFVWVEYRVTNGGVNSNNSDSSG